VIAATPISTASLTTACGTDSTHRVERASLYFRHQDTHDEGRGPRYQLGRLPGRSWRRSGQLHMAHRTRSSCSSTTQRPAASRSALAVPYDEFQWPQRPLQLDRKNIWRVAEWSDHDKCIYIIEGGASYLSRYDPQPKPAGSIELLSQLAPAVPREPHIPYATLSMTIRQGPADLLCAHRPPVSTTSHRATRVRTRGDDDVPGRLRHRDQAAR